MSQSTKPQTLAAAEPAPAPGADNRSPAVETRGLGKRFERHWALAHVDLEVRSGEVLLVAGANGSGKTTLVRTFSGLYRPDAGSLRIFGLDPTKDRLTCRRRVSLVSHETYLYPRLTALETLRLWARLLGRDTRDSHLVPLLAEVALAEHRDSIVAGFSAGMKKRLTLLRVQLEEPRLVLLDEPFAALDVTGQELVEEWIAGFRRRGVTVVMASHALEQGVRLCDRGVLLTRGQVLWQGDPEELLRRVKEEGL